MLVFLLGIARQLSREKFATLSLVRPWSHTGSVQHHIASLDRLGEEFWPSSPRNFVTANRELSQRPRRRQRERQKSKKFDKKNTNWARAAHFLVQFFIAPAGSFMQRLMEDVNKRRRTYLPLSKLFCGLEFNSREIQLHLAFLTSWNKHDKVWKEANSWRFAAVAAVDAKAP